MKKLLLTLFFLSTFSFSQVTTSPTTPLADGEVSIFFDKSGTGLDSYNGTIYAHIGVTVNGSQWQNVIGSWGDNSVQPSLTFVSGTTYSLTLTPDLFAYFGVDTNNTISEIRCGFS